MFADKTFALLALLTLAILSSAESKQRYNLKESFDNAIVTADLHDSLMSYIVCDRFLGKTETKLLAKKCNVTLGTVDDKGEKTTCSLDFTESMASTSFAIHALSADKSVLVWIDEDISKPHYLLKVTIVNFPSCDTSEAKIDFENHKTLFNSMIRYENAFIRNKDGTFDVLFENPKYCTDKVCRLTLNTKAEIIKGPTAAYEPIKRLFDTSTEFHEVDSTYAVYESRRDSTGRISLVKPDGRVILEEARSERSDNNDVSTLEDQIRVCKTVGGMKIACELFNTKGESISKREIRIGSKFNSFTLFNLPNGAFVLETETRKHAHATKVGADGKRIGAVKLSGYICKGGNANTIKDIYTDGNRLCMTRMCYSDIRVDVVQRCYNNAEFK